jgi:prepilin-type N-terminal cleavage/methylation domain-containing protein
MNKLRGVTLVELLVVMAVIAILSMIAYTNLSGARKEAKITTMKASMESLISSAEVCALTGGGCTKYEYTGFCNTSEVANVKSQCTKLLKGCACTCDANADSWTVSCTAGDFNFNYTCTQDGCSER